MNRKIIAAIAKGLSVMLYTNEASSYFQEGNMSMSEK